MRWSFLLDLIVMVLIIAAIGLVAISQASFWAELVSNVWPQLEEFDSVSVITMVPSVIGPALALMMLFPDSAVFPAPQGSGLSRLFMVLVIATPFIFAIALGDAFSAPLLGFGEDEEDGSWRWKVMLFTVFLLETLTTTFLFLCARSMKRRLLSYSGSAVWGSYSE